jgi:predicted negative regulator of RcsB-dependent stress response
MAASTVFERFKATLDEGNTGEGLELLETLRREHPKSAYVSAGDLIAASIYVGNNELDKAVESLQRVATTGPDEALRPIAKLRLARVQAARGDYDAALATLGTAEMGLHEAARLEVRGDVLYAKGDHAGALAEYQAARSRLAAPELQEGGVGELLDLKIADLSAKVPAVEDAAPAGDASAPAPGAPAP